MQELDKAAGKPVAPRPNGLPQLVNALMNLGRAMYSAMMDRWKPIADFPLLLIKLASTDGQLREAASDSAINDKGIALLDAFGHDKASFIIGLKPSAHGGKMRRLIVVVPRPIMAKYSLRTGQEVAAEKVLPIIDEAAAWVSNEITIQAKTIEVLTKPSGRLISG